MWEKEESGVTSLGKRKISQFAIYSKAITLPLNWLKERGIDRGNYLDVFETQEGNLLLVPATKEDC